MRLLSALRKKDLEGKQVLLRADFNVPIKAGRVVDDFRLQAVLPTIKFLLTNGSAVTIISHLGRRGESLKPIKKWLATRIKSKNLTVRENLRRDPREERNDKTFARELVAGFDLYVNDAFAAAHRRHTSIVGVPKLLPSYAGLRLEKEIKALQPLTKPAKPLILIIGGAKFESKLPVINKFLPQAEKVFIGGAIANLLLKRQGYEIGRSPIDSQAPSAAALLRSKKIVLPAELIVRRSNGTVLAVASEAIRPGDLIVDVGPALITAAARSFSCAKTIIWSGPLGIGETGNFGATVALAEVIGRSGADSIVGGGDTIALLGRFGLLKKFTFVSTGGGAMLEFLTTGTLPGIEELK